MLTLARRKQWVYSTAEEAIQDALARIRLLRPGVRPNPGFIRKLMEYYEHLAAT
jgi:hypothetical protein